jgi:SAM-dependent methyltransferase
MEEGSDGQNAPAVPISEKLYYHRRIRQNMKLLNLGCGNRYHSDWTNLDFVGVPPHVRQHNLLQGIPFEENIFDAVYHSHVLEHFSKEDAVSFISECHRVLKKGGSIRIAVPDLERIAENYLKSLKTVLDDENELNRANYEWAVIEMYDQTVRRNTGGAMAKFWRKEHLPNESAIAERMGYEFTAFRRAHLGKRKENNPPATTASPGLLSRIRRRLSGEHLKAMLLTRLLGPDYPSLAIGKFRLSGEIHQWMYDRYSLKRMLEDAGFGNVRVATAFESRIPEWDKYASLDVEDGKTRKPDSIFIEGSKI